MSPLPERRELILRLSNILKWFNQTGKIRAITMLTNDTKTFCANRHKCITTILHTCEIAYVRHCSHWIGLLIKMLALRTCQHNPKSSLFALTIKNHLTITQFKDMQRRHGSRKKHYI